jgi:hypothetical protein
MQKFIFITSAVALAAAVSAASAADIPRKAPMPVKAAPAEIVRWTFSLEGIYAQRNRATDPINTGTLDPGEVFYDFGDLANRWAWGGAITAKYQINPLWSAWLRGMYIGEFGGNNTLCTIPASCTLGSTSTTYSVFPGNNTLTNNTLGGFTAFTSNLRSSVWSVEGNAQRDLLQSSTAKVGVYGGPRYINFRDRLAMRFFEDPDDFAGLDDEAQTLSIETKNQLFGGHLGLTVEKNLVSGLWFNGRAGIGVYANRVTRNRLFVEDEAPATVVVNDSITRTVVAWSAEVAPGFSWRVAPNATVDLGYYLLWLNNVSRAPSHFETVATIADANIRANSQVLIHGARFGVTFRH